MKGFILLALVCLPFFAHAGVYKWVDENGNIHFGDRPPAEAVPQSVNVVSQQQPEVDPSAQERQRKVNDFLKQRQEENDKKNEQRAEREAKAARQEEKYTRMRARLKNMERISAFYRLNDTGERVFVSDEGGDRMRARAKADYKRQCGG